MPLRNTRWPRSGEPALSEVERGSAFRFAECPSRPVADKFSYILTIFSIFNRSSKV